MGTYVRYNLFVIRCFALNPIVTKMSFLKCFFPLIFRRTKNHSFALGVIYLLLC